ncbi:MAG: hypothetical protein PHT16_03935 [Candidatus Pacebacteria bacterium]|nr:hypothetical protein [Candidatus Paceibacterota bacterium]
MKKSLLSFLFTLVLLSAVSNFALAEGVNVNLTVKNNGEVVYVGSVALLPAGTISINDSSGNPHDTNADSVLSIVNIADASSGEFNISNLIYYDMFSAFYLKCINVSGSELCDNWQYKVDGDSPAMGMDSKILSGGENVVLYFGDENKTPAPTPEPEPEPETPPVHRSSGGGGYIVLNTVCEEGTKFSATTGRPCTSFIPSSIPVSPTVTPPLLNVNLEEKLLGHSPTDESKSVFLPTTEKLSKKTNEAVKQNTATVINAVSQTPSIPQTETPKKSWWNRFWDNIFSIF